MSSSWSVLRPGWSALIVLAVASGTMANQCTPGCQNHDPYKHCIGPYVCPDVPGGYYQLPGLALTQQWSCGGDGGDPFSVNQMGQFADVNGDGLMDVVYSFSYDCYGCTPETQCVYINNGKGWVLSSKYTPPHTTENAAATENGAESEIKQDSAGSRSRFNGTTETSPPVEPHTTNTTETWRVPTNMQINGPDGSSWVNGQSLDVNGDGLLDFVVARSQSGPFYYGTYLNTGKGYCVSYENGAQHNDRMANGDSGIPQCSSIPSMNMHVPKEDARITRFLASVDLMEYAPAFAEHKVEFELLPDLTDTDLEKIGIRALGARRKIFKTLH